MRSQQSSWNQQKTEQVLTFQIDRFSDDGAALRPIPVEMRGLRFRGFINDGDWVEVRKSWEEGDLLEPSKVRNLSTGATVKTGGSSSGWIGLLLFITLAVVGVILVIQFSRRPGG
jgi:hypothetical protein